MYAARKLSQQSNVKVILLEFDSEPFKRATYINQARVHMGYHYPRSISTAKKTAYYFRRFLDDYAFAIHRQFKQVYATSSHFSWTNAKQFYKFCDAAGIFCEGVNPNQYFNRDICDGAFLTEEYTYDAGVLRNYFMEELSKRSNVIIFYNIRIKEIRKISQHEKYFEIVTNQGIFCTSFLLNATYASVNEIISFLGFEPFKIKYELCEIILCDTNEKLADLGLTVMDGPFFSIMPFGLTGLHSLTAVTFTPHKVSHDIFPTFSCQAKAYDYCNPNMLGNCNDCKEKPNSAWPYMSNLAKKYMKYEYQFHYRKSLFSIKPILVASEIDDSRPTIIRTHCKNPTFISVLSGKINTVYDLDEVLQDE